MAIGDFGAVLDSKAFAQIAYQPPSLRKRTENVVLLLSSDLTPGYPYLRSISISDLGIINTTPLDTLVLGTLAGRDMGLLHWLDDVFVAYANDQFANAKVWTIGCDDAGVITDAPLDELAVGQSANAVCRSDLFKPHDGILLTGPCFGYTGYHVQTVAVTDVGIMPATVLDSMDVIEQPLMHNIRQGAGDRIIDLGSIITQYYIYSFPCTDAGALPAGVTDYWGPITTTTRGCSLCKISNTVFAVFVEDSDGTVWIHTFSINPDGTINKAWLDSEQVDDASTGHLHMMEMGQGYFVTAYTRSVEKWRFKTYFIATDGTIQDGHIDTMDRATGNRGNQRFEHLQGNIWTFTYESVSGTILIDTMEISTPGAEGAHNELVLGIGP